MPALALPGGVDWLALAEFSLALLLILYAEYSGSIRSFALKRDEEVQPTRDLLALGVANVLCGLPQGPPVGPGYSATRAHAAAGARSALAGLYAGAVVLTLVLLFLRWVERIPEPALAAIVIHAVSKALRPGVFADYFRWQRDRMLVVAAVLTVMIFGVLNRLLAGNSLKLVPLLKSRASPPRSGRGSARPHPSIKPAHCSP